MKESSTLFKEGNLNFKVTNVIRRETNRVPIGMFDFHTNLSKMENIGEE